MSKVPVIWTSIATGCVLGVILWFLVLKPRASKTIERWARELTIKRFIGDPTRREELLRQSASETPKPTIWIDRPDGTREYAEVTPMPGSRGQGVRVGWDGVPRDFWTREPLPLNDGDDGVETR